MHGTFLRAKEAACWYHAPLLLLNTSAQQSIICKVITNVVTVLFSRGEGSSVSKGIDPFPHYPELWTEPIPNSATHLYFFIWHGRGLLFAASVLMMGTPSIHVRPAICFQMATSLHINEIVLCLRK